MARRDSYDDDRGGRSRSRGGWFGDPEGHAEFARRRGTNNFTRLHSKSFKPFNFSSDSNIQSIFPALSKL